MTSIRARRGAPWWAAAMLAVLAGGLLLAIGAAAPSRAAEPVEFTLVFDDLTPGESRTESATIELARDATLTSIAWVERTGLLADGTLDVVVCGGGDCADTVAFESTPMRAGTIDVSVTVVAPADLAPGASGTALGRLAFVADEGGGAGLPATGAAVGAIAWGVALLAAGALLAGIGALRSRRSGARS
ncbi:hypothetical protein [Agromyces aureus]|uniref:Uncharacterized protein n=1 Tax=Agromyces aureus TaxID=453304 RepID=A0A191WCK0_9MICO|nr:hypothetical protein [Agromyces aureus]ANJ25909.1 hypothetical protein ATC03_03285 [Agromyces aureus]